MSLWQLCLSAAVFIITACNENHLYEDVLLESAPDYYVQLTLADTNNQPIVNHQVTTYKITREDFFRPNQPGISDKKSGAWGTTDMNGMVGLYLPAGYFQVVVQVPPEMTHYASFGLAVTPDGKQFVRPPRIQFSNLEGLVVMVNEAIPIIPTGQPLAFTADTLPHLTIRANGQITEYPQPLPIAGGTPPYFFTLLGETISPSGFSPNINNLTRQIQFMGYMSSYPAPLNHELGILPLGAVTLRVRDSRNAEITGSLTLNARFKHAFISDRATKGDMSGLTYPGCSGTGVQRADCACRVQAQQAGLPNPEKFRALLETTTISAKCRLTPNPASCVGTPPPSAGGPWYSPRRQISPGVFGRVKYFDNMFSAAANPITTNASGGEHSANVWTGTIAGGDSPAAPATVTCNNWTSQSNGDDGNVGTTDANFWAANGSFNCSNECHIYCFEVD